MNYAQAWNRMQEGDWPKEAMGRWPQIVAAMVFVPTTVSPHGYRGGLSISNMIRQALRKENNLTCHQLAERTGRGYESVKCVLRRYMKDVEPRRAADGKTVLYRLRPQKGAVQPAELELES